MRRIWMVGILVAVATVAGAAGYQRGAHWKRFDYTGTRLKADLGTPDAVVRTASLSALPRDLLKAPVARDVLTEDLVFYYEQHEDRLGLRGAFRRIAYEHQLGWSDRVLQSAFDEPAELAFWRDGKGALRHFAMVMRRNALATLLQQAAQIAMKDQQLTLAGEIDANGEKLKVFALALHPRRTLLLVAQGKRLVVLSDPGLLYDGGNKPVPAAQQAIAEWLARDGVLASRFALEEPGAAAGERGVPRHTLAVGAPALALGYDSFVPALRGIRLDFRAGWTTSAWIDGKAWSAAGGGLAALWRAAPANPAACVAMPVDWQAAVSLVAAAERKPALPSPAALASLSGPALACWYGESRLHAPVFIARLAGKPGERNAALSALADWAMAVPAGSLPAAAAGDGPRLLWQAEAGADDTALRPALAAHGAYVAFSPDGRLVNQVIAALARKLPSVADQMPAGDATLGVVTPRRMAAMAEREAYDALSGAGEANLRGAAQSHLPARMKALSAYPAVRLDLAAPAGTGGWRRLDWHAARGTK